MDKIFQEIKKAIEEEMRNAESGPPPSGGRSQGGGGRRAQEYAEWLKEEQDRLRGGGSGQQAPRPVDVEVQQPEAWSSEQDLQRPQPRAEQPRSREPRSESRRPDRQQSQSDRRQQREQRSSESRQRQPREGQRQRQPRQERDAYQLRTASQMGGQIQRLLRSPNGLRQAFLLREIISKPVSLRDQDDHLIT